MDKNEEDLKNFRNELISKTCEFPDCNERAFGISRTKLLCKKHFLKIRLDNKKRIRKGIEITEELK